MKSDINVIRDYQRHLRSMEMADVTIVDYVRTIMLLNDWLMKEYHMDFSTPGTIKGYMISMYCTSLQPLKISTRSTYLTITGAFLRWLHAMQYVDHDLSKAIAKLPSMSRYLASHPEEAPNKRGYTHDEIRAMLSCKRRNEFITHRDRAIVVTMLATGLRVSELASLTVADIIDKPDTLYVARKGTHGQKVPVSIASAAYPYIMRYLEVYAARFGMYTEGDALWVSETGKPLNRFDVCKSLQALQKKVGVPTGTHTLRHTMITEVTKQANPIVARDAAGQKSISVTNRYMHSTREEIREAVDLVGELILQTSQLLSDADS